MRDSGHTSKRRSPTIAAILSTGVVAAAAALWTFVDTESAAPLPSPHRVEISSREWFPGFLPATDSDAAVRYYARGPGMRAQIVDDGVWLCLGATTAPTPRLHVVKLAFEGGRRVEPISEGASTHPVMILRGGADAASSVSARPTVRIRWKDVWDGVDVVMHRDRGVLEYDVHARDATALSRARFRWIGVDGPIAARGGELVAETSAGTLALADTVAWSDDDARRPIASRHVLFDDGTFGLAADASDGAVCVDPGIVFSGWLGGSGLDAAFGTARGSDGAVFVAGETASPDFPTTPGALDTTLAGTQYDAFVAKLAPTGASVTWATFIGGAGSADRAMAVAVDAAGSAYITGGCAANWPTTPGAFDTSFNQWGDAFVAKLTPSGGALAWSGYLGGSLEDRGYGIALDAAGAVCVTGKTQSSDYPVTSGAVATPASNWDVMLTKVHPSGSSLVWSCRFGGSAIDWGFGVSASSDGGWYVAGSAVSSDFPNTSGVAHAGGFDAFVVKVAPDGRSLPFATRVGGGLSDQGLAVATAPDGGCVVAGVANPGFPDDGANPAKGQDLFAARFTSAGARLWSRLVGGSSTEQAQAVGFDDAGRAVLVGSTNSFDFPTTWDAFDAVYDGGGSPGDGVVVVLDGGDGALRHGTFFGGDGYDDWRAAVVSAPCRVTMAGVGNSTVLPGSAASFGPVVRGLDDAVVAALDVPPAARTLSAGGACGASTTAFTGTVPVLGTSPVLAAVGAPEAAGWLLLSDVPVGAPVALGACATTFDPASLQGVVPVVFDGAGTWSVPVALPSVVALAGIRVRLGLALLAPSEPLGIAASNGVEWRLGN